MRWTASFVIIMTLLTGCEKEEDNSRPAPLEMETGVFSGKYISKEGGVQDVQYQFKVSINKVNDTLFSIQQIDAGSLPGLLMTKGISLSTGVNTKIKFRIPRQDTGGINVVGDGNINSGYDAQWSALNHSITFGIVLDNDPQRYIRFTGIKE